MFEVCRLAADEGGGVSSIEESRRSGPTGEHTEARDFQPCKLPERLVHLSVT